MDWARILAFVTGMVDQELLARNEYLAAENRILKAQLKGRLKLSDAERATLGEIGHRLGRQVLGEVANVARPETILAWYRKLVARKFDGSKARRSPGRPRISREVEQLIVRMAKENRDWGYDRIAGALANLGYQVCDQTVGNVLLRHGLPPAPERKRTTTWSAFIRTHLALLAGTDFFTAEVLTRRGLVTYYVLFFIHLESRRVDIAGITVHPDERWMQQIARNVTMEGCGALRDCRYLLHDRDTKYTQSFRAIIASGRVEPLVLPARSPNLNAYAERWVRSVKEECLSKVVLPRQQIHVPDTPPESHGAQRAKRCDRGVQRGTDRPPSYLILLFLGWGLGAIRRIRAASRYRRRRGCRGPASSIIEEASENP
jgi:hypothetical protein